MALLDRVKTLFRTSNKPIITAVQKPNSVLRIHPLDNPPSVTFHNDHDEYDMLITQFLGNQQKFRSETLLSINPKFGQASLLYDLTDNPLVKILYTKDNRFYCLSDSYILPAELAQIYYFKFSQGLHLSKSVIQKLKLINTSDFAKIVYRDLNLEFIEDAVSHNDLSKLSTIDSTLYDDFVRSLKDRQFTKDKMFEFFDTTYVDIEI